MLKHYKRADIWKNYNGNNYLDVKEMRAKSYKWWIYLKRIGGKAVFQSGKYSISTSKHQRDTRRLLDDLGVKVDLIVDLGSVCLSEFSSKAIPVTENRILELETAIVKGRNGSRIQNNRVAELDRFKRQLESIKKIVAKGAL